MFLETVRPVLLENFLEFLNHHNHLYSDIEDIVSNIPKDITDFN